LAGGGGCAVFVAPAVEIFGVAGGTGCLSSSAVEMRVVRAVSPVSPSGSACTPATQRAARPLSAHTGWSTFILLDENAAPFGAFSVQAAGLSPKIAKFFWQRGEFLEPVRDWSPAGTNKGVIQRCSF
jgi:hypothetical protein